MPNHKHSLSTYALIAVISTASLQSVNAASYTVRPGDSFSAIADRELGDASRWREIWSLNPQVRTPESLSAGTRIQLPDGRMQPAPRMETQPDASSIQPPATQQPSKPSASEMLAREEISSGRLARFMAHYRLMPASSISSAARFVAQRSEANGEAIYAENVGSNYGVGQTFGVFREDSNQPISDYRILKRVALARLDYVADNKAKFLLLNQASAAEKGDLILPAQHPASTSLNPKEVTKQISARLKRVYHETPDGYFALIDAGLESGVQPGQIYHYFKKDFVRQGGDQAIEEFPTQPGGSLMILSTESGASLAKIITSRAVPAADDRVQ